jgi:hypothetical protein
LLATDTIAHLSTAFRFRSFDFHFRSGDKGGYVWLQGTPR